MHRLVAILSGALLLGTAAGAQCFVDPDPTHGNLGLGDDTLFAAQSIGFVFPHTGSPFTDVHVSTNGLCYLSNGGVPAPGGPNGDAGGSYASAAGQLATLLGGAPKILPFFRDLDLRADRDAGVFFRPGTPSPAATPCVITWVNAVDYGDLGPPKTIQCQLHESGRVDLFYSGTTAVVGAAPVTVGRSPGGGAADPGASNLSAGPTSGSDTIYEPFATGAFDLAAQSLELLPTLPGHVVAVGTCTVGSHEVRGAGCYGDSFYQHFAQASDAWLALQGHAITLQPTATGYVAQFVVGGASAFVAPVGATDFARSDDDQVALDLTANGMPPLALPGGSTSMLWVHMNGIVSASGPTNDDGAWNSPPNDYTPGAAFVDAPETAFWAWHDWNPSDLAGGPVRWHYDGALGTLYVTWDGVENWSVPAAPNPGTFQFQFQLASGLVRFVWVTVDTDTTSPFGSAHLVGYSPGGASADPGSLPIGFAGGTTTIDGYRALRLDAAPRPVLGGTGGPSNTIGYTVDNLPDYAAPAGLRLGILCFSVASAPSVDLGVIGASGCQAYIASLDVQLPIVQLGPAQQSIQITFPPPLPIGTVFHSQAVALIPQASYPGGLNAFGLLTSNGLETRF